jgi:predicted Rossmann fold flavoprotein
MFGAHIKKQILFVEANPYFGAKIKISGGGKCNLTNECVSSKNYLGDDVFINETLEAFSSKETLGFFAKFGVKPSVKKDGQYFCKTSNEVLNAFSKANAHHQFLFGKKVKNLFFKNGEFVAELENDAIVSKRVVVASGGLSYQTLNASGIGYEIAKNFNIEIKTASPSLVGLSLQKEQFWFKELSGVSLRAKIKCGDFSYDGDLLFSHRGVSGPVVLNTSLRWKSGTISVDFLPDFDMALSGEIWNEKRQLTTILPLPKSFIKAFLSSLCLSDKALKSYSLNEREKIVLLKNYIMAPAGTFGFSKAEVTKGGVATEEITSQTYESKKQRGLYFIGEVLDVTGELGGYNLQWAFSSGFCAAKNF